MAGRLRRDRPCAASSGEPANNPVPRALAPANDQGCRPRTRHGGRGRSNCYAACRSDGDRLLPKASLPFRLALLVAGMVLPLTVFAAVLVYYNYETSRTTAYDRILQIARGLTTNIDSELRATIASLQVLALSEALARDDIAAFRAQAEHFVAGHFPQSNVVVWKGRMR